MTLRVFRYAGLAVLGMVGLFCLGLGLAIGIVSVQILRENDLEEDFSPFARRAQTMTQDEIRQEAAERARRRSRR